MKTGLERKLAAIEEKVKKMGSLEEEEEETSV